MFAFWMLLRPRQAAADWEDSLWRCLFALQILVLGAARVRPCTALKRCPVLAYGLRMVSEPVAPLCTLFKLPFLKL